MTPRTSPPTPPPPPRQPLVLIVDDEDNFLEIMSTALRAAGFEVATAKNGKEAVIKAAELIPNLILMDIYMPQETGTDVALNIKQNPKTRDIKIAFLTNLKEPWPAIAGDRKKIAMELGMEDFLEKTDDLSVLVSKVQELINS